ncbi:MAG: outer membrane lipoprotein carrier protein LolA, partial [Cytophagales bacterium]|nr:outer membrane lipoprotein carrier protein LolA [Cytophagales bacterium]
TVTTIRSDFTQEKKLSVMSKKITSKGKFLFKKENKLRLEYVEPFAYLMVVNKDKIYIKDEGKVSTYDARSNKLFRQINTMILASIQGMGNTKDFQSTYFESDKQYLLIMKPLTKSVSEMIKSLEIYLDKKDCSVVKFDMVEPSGDYTSIQLTTKEINVPVTDDNFVLK